MKEVKGQKKEPLLLGGVFAVPSSQMDRKRARARWPLNENPSSVIC